MKLTTLCLCGTLLALSSFPSTTADSDEGDLLDRGFGPCAATLRPEGLCRQGQDESMCPYLFSLPPLTLHLPKQLRELEKIVKDLQKLKDNVDQLRKMCADCTVSQSVRECGRQSEGEHERLNEGAERDGAEVNWLNERKPERPKDLGQDCGTEQIKTEKSMAGDDDSDLEKILIWDEKQRKNWEEERERDEEVVKENEREKSQKEVADGKTKGKDKLGQAKVQTPGGNERVLDMARKEVDKNKEGKGNSKKDPEGTPENGKEEISTSNVKNKEKTEESDHHVWREKTKETERKTQTKEDKGSDGIKMSEGHDEHTNKEREQHGEERKKEMENGIKVERNNEKPKQTESIGHAGEEKTIKGKEEEEEDGEMGTEMKTEGEKTSQGDGGLTSSRATGRTDFVSISPTIHSIISSAPKHDIMDSNKATSSLPPPPLSSWTSYWTHVNHRVTAAADGPTQTTGPGAAGSTSRPTTMATINTPTDLRQQISSPTSGSEVGLQGQDTTTESPTTFPRGSGRWTARKNISSNTKTGMKPQPGRGSKPNDKSKPADKPEAEQKLQTFNSDSKPDRADTPDRKPKHDQKQKPSQRKPTTDQKPKSGKDPKQGQITKPGQRPLLDHSATNQNQKRTKHDPESSTDQSQLLLEKPEFPQRPLLPVQTPKSPQDPPSEPPADQDHESPEKMQVHPFKTSKPDQIQKPQKKQKSEKPKPDQRTTINQNFPHVHKPKPERTDTMSLTPKPDQEPVSEILENPSKPTPGHLSPDKVPIKPPDQKPKTSPKIPKTNQKLKPRQKHPELVTGKTKPKVKPKLDQTNQRLRKPQPDLNTKSTPDKIPEVASNKSRPPPSNRSLTRPEATSVQSPKTKIDLDPSQISKNTLDAIQSSQAEPTPAPGDGSPEFSPSTMKTIPLGPQTSNSLDGFPHHGALSEGFTTSPNRRITSDLKPQTASPPPSIPMTTRTNKIIRGILPSVVPSSGPGSTPPDQAANTHTSLYAKIQDTGPRQTPDPNKPPVPNPSSQTTTTSPDFRSTTPATSDPETLDATTPSARELRVKINQVAAFFNNSKSPSGRSLDRQLEDMQGGSRPDSKLPSLTSSKVNVAVDCSDHLLKGKTRSGVYLVTPDLRSRSFPVYCDMALGGGGWTLLQRRHDGSVSFNRSWAEYRSGFGKLDGGEFWLGNNMIHLLTRDRDMVLRVELEDFEGVMEYAEYEQFKVASERMRYRLTVGGYSGTAGDALRFSKTYDHNNRAFTTPDRDHDRYPSGNCGAYYSSGWWFDACMAANLNGRYYTGRYKGVRDGIFWGTWQNISTEYYPTNERQSFKSVRMMIRPKGFVP